MTREQLNEAVAEHILYVIVLPQSGSGEFSPFQGFSINTFAALNAIHHICTLPTTVVELFRTRDEALRFRSIGLSGYAIVLLDLDSLHKFTNGLPLTCFVSDQNTRKEVEQHIAAQRRDGWLHLTTDGGPSSVPKLWDYGRVQISSWSRSVAEAAFAGRSGDGSTSPPESWRSFVDWPEENAHLDSRLHNVTAPTESVFRSLNLALAETGNPLVGNRDDDFALALATASDELARVRHEAHANHHRIPGSPVVIVTVPSVYRHLSPGQLKPSASRVSRRVFRAIIRQSQYTAMQSSGDELKEILADSIAPGLMNLRAQELAAYTAALSVAASSLGIPVLRCPPQVDRVRELLIRLAGMSRGKSPNVERQNRLAVKIGESLQESIPSVLLRRIEQHQNDGIKLIGDTPLELLPVNDLPLGLRATVSRTPTLPGNLLMRQGLLRTPLLVQPEELTKVLVVRAFDRDDPLRDVLVNSIKFFNSQGSNEIDLVVVDVSTKEEFAAAFNNFDGRVAIFDGHGSHERTDPQGTIRVGAIRFNPFELYGHVKVPPILFLSACETHTLEGIESSVATAFLMMGARSVLGTIVPIHGLNAAILMARFVYRFTDFVPLLRTMMPWSQVVSGMLRMSYVTDVLRAMEKQFSFGEAVYKRIHYAANTAINEFRPRWFEEILSSLAQTLSMTEARVREIWLKTCYFTDTLHYVHLGQPEHIFVVPGEESSLES